MVGVDGLRRARRHIDAAIVLLAVAAREAPTAGVAAEISREIELLKEVAERIGE